MPKTHSKPGILLITNIALTFALANVALFFLITEPANRKIWSLVLIILFVSCLSFIAMAYRQRLTLYPDRIEFQGLLDRGTIQRDEIKAAKGRFQTILKLRDKPQCKLPNIRNLTPIMRDWLEREPDA